MQLSKAANSENVGGGTVREKWEGQRENVGRYREKVEKISCSPSYEHYQHEFVGVAQYTVVVVTLISHVMSRPS